MVDQVRISCLSLILPNTLGMDATAAIIAHEEVTNLFDLLSPFSYLLRSFKLLIPPCACHILLTQCSFVTI
jgi:hypothetical protein